MKHSHRATQLVGALASSRYAAGAHAVALMAAMLFADSAAHAACIPPAGPVVTCTGNTINPAGSGFGTGAQTGFTVNVEPGATVRGSTFGITLDGNNTINNFGTVSGNAPAVQLSSNSTVNNSGIISSLGSAPGVFLTSNNNTINNSGTISSASGEGIRMGSGTTITNSGTISGNIGITGGTGNTIINSGTVTGSAGGVATINLSGGGSGIINSGAILGGPDGAIAFFGTNNTLTLLPSSVIVGTVASSPTSATDELRLGGSGTGSFDVGLIGPAQQYRQFDVFRKVGDSTWTLTGTGTYAGPTIVDAGTLIMNASLPSSVLVNSGATLMGSGTIAGLTAASGATVAPNNGIGTLNVTNVSFAAGSLYQVGANAAGAADKIAATGTATLAGGTVQALAETGEFAPSTTYTILSATSGVTGTFSSVTSNLAFLSPSLSYDANDVFLTLIRNTAFFSDFALTPNQRAVAGALDASQLGSPLVLALLNQTASGAQQAYDALSGEIHGSVQTTMLDDSHYLRQALLGRLRQASFVDQTGRFASLAFGGPIVAHAGPAAPAEPALAYASASKPAFPVKALPISAPQIPDTAWWAQGVGAWGKIDSDGNAADASRNLGGFFSGVDRCFGDNWRAGFAGGYTSSHLNVGGRGSSANIDTAHLAAYAGASYGPWNLRSGAAGSWSTIGTNRSIVFPGFAEQATARYDATTAQVFGEIGYGMTVGMVAAEPFAGLAWVHLNTGDFNETGGIAALAGSGGNDDVGYSSLGLRAATDILLSNTMVLTPRASIAWQHAIGRVTPTEALAFQSTGAGFTIAGVPLARDTALVDIGIDLRVSPSTTIGVSYVGQLASSAQDHSVRGHLIWRF